MLSGQEVRRKVVEGLRDQAKTTRDQKMRQIAEQGQAQLSKYEEVAHALEEMTRTQGWRILEEWMTIQMDLFGIVFEENPEKEREIRARAKAYATLMVYVKDAIETPERVKALLAQKEQS